MKKRWIKGLIPFEDGDIATMDLETCESPITLKDLQRLIFGDCISIDFDENRQSLKFVGVTQVDVAL